MPSDKEYNPVAYDEPKLYYPKKWGNLHVISVLFIRHTRLLEHISQHVIPFVVFFIIQNLLELRDQMVDIFYNLMAREPFLQLGEDDVTKKKAIRRNCYSKLRRVLHTEEMRSRPWLHYIVRRRGCCHLQWRRSCVQERLCLAITLRHDPTEL